MLEMNKVFLIGNLTQDPEIRSLTSGTSVAALNIAVNRRYKDRNGEWQEETLFIGIDAWGRLAEFCADWLKKGKRIFVEGRLKLDTWEARDGGKRSRIKVNAERIQFADPPRSQGSFEDNSGQAQKNRRSNASSSRQDYSSPDQGPEELHEEPDVTDDDLPF